MVIHPGFLEAVFLWAAGLIWRKYDVRANNTQIEDDGYVVSYGDQLIIDAKKQLQPHKYKDFGCW